jgi:NitT/TauT family transport system permease protein
VAAVTTRPLRVVVGALAHVVVFAGVIALWALAAKWEIVPPVVVPGPGDVVEALREVVKARWFVEALLTTATEAAAGLFLATLVGGGVGLAVGTFTTVGRAVQPFIVALQVMPSVVLAPIFLVWLGSGLASKIMLAFVISFFVILVNTIEGVRRVPSNSVRLMRSLDASRWRVLRSLTFPSVLPYVFAGLRTSVTLALVGALVGEFVGARIGLGQKLLEFSFALKTAEVWAMLVVIGVVGLVLYGIVALLDRRLAWWKS